MLRHLQIILNKVQLKLSLAIKNKLRKQNFECIFSPIALNRCPLLTIYVPKCLSLQPILIINIAK